MADIKTRDVTRASIKTIDRAASSMHHIKEAAVRTKAEDISSRYGDETETHAQERIEHYAGDSTVYAAKAGAEIIQRNIHKSRGNINEPEQKAEIVQQAFREQGAKTICGKQRESRMMTEETLRNTGEYRRNSRIRERSAAYGTPRFVRKNARSAQKAMTSNERIQESRREYAIKRIISRQENNRQTILSMLRPGRTRGAQAASDVTSSFLRYIWEHARSYILTIGGGSAAAVIVVTLFVFFGVGTITFSNNSPDTSVTDDPEEIVYFIPDLTGSPTRYAIVKAAAREVGIVGGEKFWRWYGFKGHVHWCACFTSYIAAECGCIQSGICPKSALVDDWISFYKKQHRWARGDYIPHSGDFIIFDWEGDGQPDHIGIVESCDGKTVHTIEGNSHDICRRKTYARGSWVIYGYCCPNYSGT